jgi:hypothetical protein
MSEFALGYEQYSTKNNQQAEVEGDGVRAVKVQITNILH